MKTLLMLLVWTFSCQISFSQNSKAIFIGQSTLGGIRNYNNLIATNDATYSEIEHKMGLQNKIVSKSLIENESMKKVLNFISKHCNSTDITNERTTDKVLIEIYSKNASTICYVIDKDQIKLYFKQLNLVTQKLTNKKDKKTFEEMIKGIIRIVNHK